MSSGREKGGKTYLCAQLVDEYKDSATVILRFCGLTQLSLTLSRTLSKFTFGALREPHLAQHSIIYFRILTQLGGMQVPCGCPDSCRGYPGTLAHVGGMQVPCGCPDPCQGYAGTLPVPWPVSGVCRYPAGALTHVRGMQVPCQCPDPCRGYAKISLLSLWFSVFQGASLLAPVCPIEKMILWVGFLYSTSGSNGDVENVFARTGYRTSDPGPTPHYTIHWSIASMNSIYDLLMWPTYLWPWYRKPSVEKTPLFLSHIIRTVLSLLFGITASITKQLHAMCGSLVLPKSFELSEEYVNLFIRCMHELAIKGSKPVSCVTPFITQAFLCAHCSTKPNNYVCF